MNKRVTQISAGLLVTLLFALHIVGKVEIGVINVLENLAYDTLVKITTREGKDERIVIVDIDEKTLREMGQWPWPRENIKNLLDNLFDLYKINTLGFDMVFAEKDGKSGMEKIEQIANKTEDSKLKKQLLNIATSLSGDTLLANGIEGRSIVLGYYFNHDKALTESVGQLPEPVFEDDGFMDLTIFAVDATSFNANLPQLQNNAETGGFFSNPLIDEDGTIRRVPLLHQFEGALYESLPLAVARIHLGEIVEPVFGEAEIEPGIPLMEAIALGDRVVAMDSRGAVMIPFRGGRGSFPYISATDVVNARVENGEILKDAIVLLGTSAIGLSDLRATPVDAVYPGVEAHANVIAGLLDNSFKSKSAFTWAIELASVVALGLMLALWLPFLSPMLSAVLVGSILTTVIGVNLYQWQILNTIIPIAATLATIGLIYVTNTVFGLFKETRHMKEVRKSFSSYLAPALVEQLVDDPSSLKLEGESRNMTFLFTDIANFTTFTEKTEARLLVKVLNEYLDQACQLIMEHGGTIDKMIGDAIVAIFNAPVLLKDHEQRAVQTALALDLFCYNFVNQKQAQGIDMGLTRIGINTGHAVVGNFGGISRFDYTVIGDSVNTAARLESVNKFLGTRMCVSGATVDKCPDLFFRPVANLVLKGKTVGIDAYEPLSEEMFNSDHIQQYLALFESLKSDQKPASKALEALRSKYPDDPVIQLHLNRHNLGHAGIIIVMDEK